MCLNISCLKGSLKNTLLTSVWTKREAHKHAGVAHLYCIDYNQKELWPVGGLVKSVHQITPFAAKDINSRSIQPSSPILLLGTRVLEKSLFVKLVDMAGSEYLIEPSAALWVSVCEYAHNIYTTSFLLLFFVLQFSQIKKKKKRLLLRWEWETKMIWTRTLPFFMLREVSIKILLKDQIAQNELSWKLDTHQPFHPELFFWDNSRKHTLLEKLLNSAN